MAEKLRASVRIPPLTFGHETYDVFVDITNLSDKPLDEITVTKKLVPGLIIEPKGLPEFTELTKLEFRKRKIMQEMEVQVGRAYEQKELRTAPTLKRLIALTEKKISISFPSLIPFDIFTILVSDETNSSVPSWARQALRIEDWDDIEKIENVAFDQEAENSLLLEAFSINKSKLRKILDELEVTRDTAKSIKRKDTYTLQPGETISFHFAGKAPFVYRVRDYPLQFTVTYRDPEHNTVGSFSVSKNITFSPSSLAIGFGAFCGAISGFIIRGSLITPETIFSQQFLWNFGGSILFAIVITFLTARTAGSKKPITVEDFVGGFIVGAVSVLFFESIMDKLRMVIQTL